CARGIVLEHPTLERRVDRREVDRRSWRECADERLPGDITHQGEPAVRQVLERVTRHAAPIDEGADRLVPNAAHLGHAPKSATRSLTESSSPIAATDLPAAFPSPYGLTALAIAA